MPTTEAIQRSMAAARARGFDLEPVLRRWYEPQRRYHDVVHLEMMLRSIAELAEFLGLDDDTRFYLEIAAWYHDAIYNVGAPSGENERASANLFIHDATHVLPSVAVIEIYGAILATANHQRPDRYFAAMLCDADLAGLGAPWDTYLAAAARVRLEYGAITHEQWTTGRRAFITAYTGHPCLYHTPWGARYEQPARRNLLREMAELSTGDPT